MIAATRRRFFSFVGATPLAAKAVADAEIGRMIGICDMTGLGNASLGLPFDAPAAPMEVTPSSYVPYEKRIIAAADYIQMFGMPDVMEFELRDRARNTFTIDQDIASKRSWSMAVKIMTQRQRNYDREIEKIKRSGWVQRGRGELNKFLGFNWPW